MSSLTRGEVAATMFDMPTENEDRFISWWRASEQNGCVCYTTPHRAGWVCDRPALLLVGASTMVLTPRGADLLATADHLGYDPDAKPEPAEVSPPMKACTDCNGEGRVPVGQLGGRDRTMKELIDGPDARGEQDPANPVVLPGWDVTCTTCKGAKVISVITMKDVVTAFTPVAQALSGVANAYASAALQITTDAARALRASDVEPGFADSAKRLRVNRFSGSAYFTFGKHSGKRVVDHLEYVAWMQTVDFSDDTAEVAKQICEDDGHNIDALVREL